MEIQQRTFNQQPYLRYKKFECVVIKKLGSMDFYDNAGLDEAQAGIKIARRNISKFRYADDTTLMAESEELKAS